MGGDVVTTLVLRPDPHIPTRRYLAALGEDAVEIPLGYVQFADPHWRSHLGDRAATREAAFRRIAEAAGIPGPYQIEELSARRYGTRSPRRRTPCS